MIQEGELLWTPGEERIETANLTAFIDWLNQTKDLRLADYGDLQRWSVECLEDFWQSIWDYYKVESSTPYESVLADSTMPGARWFPGAHLNYAQHVMRPERPGSVALWHSSESSALANVFWEDVGNQVRAVATQLRKLGVKPGDRVAAYMPNIPEAVVAMLATTSIGAVWSSCSPDFGSQSVLDRFLQIQPKVLFCVDGYRYGGACFDRLQEVRGIVERLETLELVVLLPYLDPANNALPCEGALRWAELLDHPPVDAAEFEFEQVPFDHPLWILFSSGTTGLPKPIVHGHGGVVLESLKFSHLHLELTLESRAFFFSTTGWVVWNLLVNTLMTGAAIILYDGSPGHPKPDVLWKMAAESRATLFGASPTYVQLMEKLGVVPQQRFDLGHLDTVLLTGSPATPENVAWFYDNVKKDLWVCSGSGGTEVCSAFVAGSSTLPVYAGEIQAACLGVDARAYDHAGAEIGDEVGELVITQSMPSMPIYFWNDPGGARYRSSYFETFAGVWRHGDFFKVNDRGGCYIQGRSDSTLNRYGVRIGTAEIYRAVESLDEVDDSLIVNLSLAGGKFFMPLFVKLADGSGLTEELTQKIYTRLRKECSPRHVPDKTIQVAAIPYTLTGKKMEVPVRNLLQGVPLEEAANPDAMTDPTSIDFFVAYARDRSDY